jgi:acyl carrier protein
MHPLLARWEANDLATLLRNRMAAPDGSVIGFYSRADTTVREQPQHTLLERSAVLAAWLAARGVRPGRPVLVVAPHPEVALTTMLACVLAGAAPALHSARPAFDDKERFRAGVRTAMDVLGPDAVVVVQARDGEPTMPVPPAPGTVLLDLDRIETTDRLALPGDPSGACHLQFTSGSTGRPKPVLVTHRNLLANIDALVGRIALGPEDVVVTWLPLYHDMGLVGQALLCLATGLDLHVLSPFDFLADPAAWLRTVSDTRGTMSATPTFGLDYVVRRVPDAAIAAMDLSSWSRVYCGAEPVSRASLERFHRKLEPAGFSVCSLKPTYGLAEATLAVTMPAVGDPPRWIGAAGHDLVRLGPVAVETGGLIGTGEQPAAGIGPVTNLGPAMDGLEVWIRDESGARVDDEDVCGEIMVRGASVTPGYLRPDGGIAPHGGDELATGDVGFLHDGELYVVERIKNIIIRNGENHSAQLLEETLADLTGLPLDQMVVVDSDLRPSHGAVTAVVEMERRGDPVELAARVRVGLERFELPLEELVVVRPGAIPRTTSGKKRHAEVRSLLAEGTLKVVDRFDLSESSTPEIVPGGRDDFIDLDEVDAGNRVLRIVAKLAAERGFRGEPEPGHRFAQDLHFDSLALYEAVMAVEAELSLDVTEEDVATLRTVGDLQQLVERRRHEKAAPARRGLTRTIDELQASMPQTLREVKAQRGRRLLIDGRWVVDFASCNYLGLDLHPEVIAAVPPMLAEFGVHPGWTRAVASPAPYGRLERALADTIGVADTVVFPTVTLAHMGILPKLAGPAGTILVDQAAHHSIQEACDLARARGTTVRTFPHGDLEALGAMLRSDTGRNRVIAVDGVYSMAGTTVDLAGLQEVARRYEATIYVDDAHGFGVLGEQPSPALPYGLNGNGVVRHLGLDYERTIYVAGMSKAYSSMCAFVSANSPSERRLAETASTMIFGGPVPVASLASALAGLRINALEGDLMRMRLWQLTSTLVDGIRELGFHVDSASGFPIVNVILGPVDLVRRAAEILWDHEVLLTPAVFPATPLDRGGVRFTVTAANTEGEVGQVLDGMRAVREAIGVGRLPERDGAGRTRA